MVEPSLPALASPSWAALLVWLLPLSSFLINGLWLGSRRPDAAARLSVALQGAAFLAVCALAFGHGIVPAPARLFSVDWLTLPTAMGEATIRISFLLDTTSLVMVGLITLLTFLVQLYSLAYMADDPERGRFFPLLSLFCFCMLGLVTAGDLIQMFLFWEGVGATSYLLIGFWHRKPTAVRASLKAFSLTRLGDAAFLGGLCLAGWHIGSWDLLDWNRPAASIALAEPAFWGLSLLTVSAVLVFLGAWGKSAQFPLHVWLPDAMEGPTPVSSLLHSATMVVAGVFLTARLYPFFSSAPGVPELIETIGVLTALFAAVVACAQTDLKRILAFSTLSQLGYMLFALGAGAGDAQRLGYSASLFHVFTHAFFKCLLFLIAGLVIHTVHGQYLKDAGGLAKRLPKTAIAAWMACLAIAGVFPFAGFYSKDEILLTAWEAHHPFTFAVGLLTGGLTAFYMFRFLFVVFYGPKSAASADASEGAHTDKTAKRPAAPAHAHGNANGHGKSPESALWLAPLFVLAVPSLLAGAFAKGYFLEKVVALGAPSWLAHATAPLSGHPPHTTPLWLPLLALLAALVGIGMAFDRYHRQGKVPEARASDPAWTRWARGQFGTDALWNGLYRRGLHGGLARPADWGEVYGINGAFAAFAGLLRFLAGWISGWQNGRLGRYAAVVISGAALLVLWLGWSAAP